MIDVLVAGGGPVGLAAAIEARLAGLSVTVVEPRGTPIDKACGEGLMPGALPLLDRLGVQPRGFTLRGVSYRNTRGAVDHLFTSGQGLGVRRTELHRALHARASDLGARFVDGRIETLAQTASGVEAGDIRARWLLGCDGLHSTVAKLAGLALPAPRRRRRFGLRRHYRLEAWSDLIEVHWNRLGELYVTPTADGVVGIALLAGKGADFEAALAASPELAARVSRAEPTTALRGAGPFRQHTRARVAGRTLMVGDASGYVDAITGEGLRLGFEQARLAVDAILHEEPERYEHDWRRATRDFRLLTSGLAAVASTPLRAAVVPCARALPGVYGAAVERLAR